MSEPQDSNESRPAHVLFMAFFGLVGWTALLAAVYLPGFAPEAVQPVDAFPFALFFLMVVATRAMAVRLLPETLVSLDAAFFIASAICLGTETAGRLVALALTLDALVRLATGGEKRRGGWGESLAFVIYFGGMSGGLLMGVGWLFRLDSRVLVGQEQVEGQVLGLVAGVGAVFLICHYLIQGARLTLAHATTWSAYARRMFLPGILAEASLLPLAVIVVLLYRPDRPLGFMLLGATYLLINFAFNQVSQGRASLERRVGELETLNRTAHALAGSLQLHELIESIARETLAAIPEAEVLALAHREKDTPHGEFVVDCYEKGHDRFRRVRTKSDEGIGGEVAAKQAALNIADLRKSDHPGDGSIRSWLGVPIVIYDEVVGVLSVQSSDRDVFGADEQRVLEAIGAQAAVAIQNARLYELATVDGLTGLYVRRYFDTRLKEELERARRFQTPFSLVLLDIDNFKSLNDTHGHAYGDKVLREIAQVMRRNMRGIDIPARYGGEEFAFILPRTAIVDAHAVAERIRADVADARITHDDQVLKITASLGVACFPESGDGDALALIEKADTALYRAKATGKNRVELFWAPDSEKRTLRGV